MNVFIRILNNSYPKDFQILISFNFSLVEYPYELKIQIS